VATTISNDLFHDFLHCKYKAYLKITGKCGQKSDYEIIDFQLSADYRRRATDHLLQSRASAEICKSPPDLPKALRQRHAIVTDGYATVDDTSVHFDALLLAAPRPASSSSSYIPVLFSRDQKMSKDDGLLVAFCGLALERLLGRPVDVGRVIHGEQFAVSRVAIPKLMPTVKKTLREIVDLVGSPPLLRLNHHCSICEFRRDCHAAAVEKNDLSLLRGLKPKELIKLNSKGIFTVTQYSYTFRPRRHRKRAAKVPVKHDHALQALAIRTNTIYVASKPSLPSTPTRLYLDVEGIPDRDFYYLIGITAWDETKTHQSFWADHLADEAKIWDSFLAFVSILSNFTLYSYGSYESRWLKTMQRRHGGDKTLIQALRSSSCNVLSAIYGHVYFPTHANDLKSIASYLGFGWSSPDASGLQSIVWRQRWEMDRLQAAKDELLRYNQEDCLALQVVTNAIERIALRSECEIGGTATSVIQTNDMKVEHPYRFGRNPYFLPEMDQINRCAYFDYQRERVYLRTSNAVRKSVRRKQHGKQAKYVVNGEQVLDLPKSCPACGGMNLSKYDRLAKIVYDLRLMRHGVKRWIVRYKSHRLLCGQCNRVFTPEVFQRTATLGLTVRAWSVYHSIAMRQSYNAIHDGLRDLFGYRGRGDIAGHLKRVATEYYRGTYHRLLDDLQNGDLIHADETKCSIRGITGYVWAFTNMETVAYIFRRSRESDVLAEALSGFNGVLISDFYTAYDSVNCIQQKCLIHLMRDINDDLFTNPCDGELKELARGFTATLRPIIETIDAHGLTRRHLHKHKRRVDQFFKETLGCDVRSEVAKGYQRRLRKYQNKLFTFLDHDGVPWNNNNAEHAIKRFALLRDVIGGTCTEAGIEEYLILLSVYETLRLHNFGFLKFLVSGAVDIDEYAEHVRRKNNTECPNKS